MGFFDWLNPSAPSEDKKDESNKSSDSGGEAQSGTARLSDYVNQIAADAGTRGYYRESLDSAAGLIDPAGGAPYYCQLSLMRYERPVVTDAATFGTMSVLKFPLPVEMRDDSEALYTNVDLQTVGDVINGQIASGSGITAFALRNPGAIIQGASKIAESVSGLLGGQTGRNVYNIVKGAARATDITPEQIGSAASLKGGIAANPNPSVQFIGPALRTFSLTWTFNPKNQQESAALHRAIRVLKLSALPTLNVNGNSALLNYPRMVKLNFYPWDGIGSQTDTKHGWTKNSIFRYGYCVMQSVNVNYAPSQATAFFKDDKRPAMISISINFKEIEYMLADHWADTHDNIYGGSESSDQQEQEAAPEGDPVEEQKAKEGPKNPVVGLPPTVTY